MRIADEFPEGGHDDLLLGPTGMPLVTPSLLRHAQRELERQDAECAPYPGGYDRETRTILLYCRWCGDPWPCQKQRTAEFRRQLGL